MGQFGLSLMDTLGQADSPGRRRANIKKAGRLRRSLAARSIESALNSMQAARFEEHARPGLRLLSLSLMELATWLANSKQK